MKTILLLSIIIISLLFSSGCSYVSYKDYYTNPEDYQELWTLSGFGYSFEGVAEVFPDSVEGLDVEKFFCRYDQQLPLGEGVQFLLQINYDEVTYKKEIERINSITYECDNSFNVPDLSFRAICLCEDGESQYVAFDEESFSVYYIYLQCIPEDEIEFEQKFIPKDYSW